MAQDKAVNVNSMILHPLADLSKASVPDFVNNLKLTFIHGKGKSGVKFHDLRTQIVKSLPSAPPPGPATFVAHCVKALLIVEPPHNEGLSHLLTSALSRLDLADRPPKDAVIARKLAASLIYSALVGPSNLEARIIVRLVLVFGIELKDVAEAMKVHEIGKGEKVGEAKAIVEPFILNLIKARSYNCAVSLMKQFNLQECTSQDFLISMVSDGKPELAGQWAAHLGKDMVCFLVQQCTEMGMLKMAYKFVQQYELHEEFPDAYYMYRQSSLQKLVRKGLWDVAVSLATEDPRLSEYLVNIAFEEGDATKAVEICNHFQLQNISLCHVLQKDGIHDNRFIQLTDIIPEEKVFWVDSSKELAITANHLSDANVVGIDCEWKANRLKGEEPNAVAILQVATPELVFIFDLINLSKEAADDLDKCLKTVFQSPNILKLGYAVHNDLKLLVKSYQDLECFHTCNSVLDLQSVAGKRARGGLSGLAKEALGNYLDKTMQMSDWEQRPLNARQLQYAALDAVVLLSIFDYICSAPSPSLLSASSSSTDVNHPASDWKRHVMSFKTISRLKKKYLGNSSCDVDCPQAAVGRSSQSTISQCAANEDLVSASCELVGLPIPGLLKSELLNLTQAARIPPPIYRSFSMGPNHATIFYCTVKVAGHTYFGCPAFTKKEAELWAAHAALAIIQGGVLCDMAGSENIMKCIDSEEMERAHNQDLSCQGLLSNEHESTVVDLSFCIVPTLQHTACYQQLWWRDIEESQNQGIELCTKPHNFIAGVFPLKKGNQSANGAFHVNEHMEPVTTSRYRMQLSIAGRMHCSSLNAFPVSSINIAMAMSSNICNVAQARSGTKLFFR